MKRKELSLTEMALKALKSAVAKVYEEHRRSGRPVAIWREGKVVMITVEELDKERKRKKAYRTKPPLAKS